MCVSESKCRASELKYLTFLLNIKINPKQYAFILCSYKKERSSNLRWSATAVTAHTPWPA